MPGRRGGGRGPVRNPLTTNSTGNTLHLRMRVMLGGGGHL